MGTGNFHLLASSPEAYTPSRAKLGAWKWILVVPCGWQVSGYLSQSRLRVQVCIIRKPESGARHPTWDLGMWSPQCPLCLLRTKTVQVTQTCVTSNNKLGDDASSWVLALTLDTWKKLLASDWLNSDLRCHPFAEWTSEWGAWLPQLPHLSSTHILKKIFGIFFFFYKILEKKKCHWEPCVEE